MTLDLVGLLKDPVGPASLVVVGDELFFTDLWKGSLYDKTMEQTYKNYNMVDYHSVIYKVSLKEVLK